MQVKLNQWVCEVCGFVYDEAKGLPDEGIPAGTAWDDIPDDWVCPYCGAKKQDFKMKKIPYDAFTLSVLNP